jgi:hypothetical protein
MSTKIERDGITALQNFLSQSDIFEPKIKDNDKYPSWDGEIIIHHSPNHTKNNIKRIPVQVKSTNRQWYENETFPIEKVDLNNYLNEGGIIFIRPIFISTTEYAIFIKILLPRNIQPLLETNRKKSKSISIDLKKVDIKQFEARCYHFLINQPKQRNIENLIDINTIKKADATFIASFLNEGNIEDSLFSDNCYFYQKINENISVPCNFRIERIGKIKKAPVSIQGKVYFKEIHIIKERDGSFFLQLNPVLKLNINQKNISLTFESSENSLFQPCLQAFTFFTDCAKVKSFSIGDKKINFSKIELDKSFYKRMKLFEDTDKLFELFRVDSLNISLKELNASLPFILKLLNIFIRKTNAIVKNEKFQFFHNFILIKRQITLFFNKIEDNKYQVVNFFSENPIFAKFKIVISENGNQIEKPCSKFLALFKTCNIKSFESNFDEVANDLAKYFDKEIIEIYEHMVLDCIKEFDLSKNRGYLVLAEKINELCGKIRHDIFTINQMQITKRQRSLTKEEKTALLSIKEKNPENHELICCVNILLESFAEFEIIFEKLDKEKKELFINWPIWNLYLKK